MRTIALMTCSTLPELSPDDRLLLPEFRRRGIEARPVVWSEHEARAGGDEALIVRSCWDYHQRLAEFLDWIAEVEAAGTPLWNPPQALRRNTRKGYLEDLARAGVPIVPTLWLDPARAADLPRLAAERGWDDVVLKPEVSAGARGTHRVKREDLASFAERARASGAGRSESSEGGRLMLQPFLREVQEAGELSFLFFGGEYSHAVVKRPAAGDFRVQLSHGGTTQPYSASREELAQARRALEAHGGATLYARVDMIPTSQGLLLGELELTEPFLFLEYDSAAPARLVDAYLSLAL